MKLNSHNNLISKDKLKDVLITKTAIKTLKDPSIVEKVVGFAFEDAKKAFRTHKEIEISGFGVFKMSNVKIIKGLAKYESIVKQYKRMLENPQLPPEKRNTLEIKIESAQKIVDFLKTKQNES